MVQLQLWLKIEMKLPSNIKIKSGLWNLIPWISNKTAQAIYPNIYIPQSMYQKLISTSPDVWSVARLIHEQEHIRRQRRVGFLVWALKYIFSKSFRYEEEISADIPKFKFIKKKGLDPYIEIRAKQLSGWLYFWPVPYKEVKCRLETIWNNLD